MDQTPPRAAHASFPALVIADRRARRTAFAVCALITVAATAPTLAQQPASPARANSASSSWRQIRTADLTVMGNAPEGDLKRALREVTAFRTVLRVLFPNMRLTSPVPTYMVVLRDFETFGRFQPRDSRGRRQNNVGGYFTRLADSNLMVFPSGRDFDYRTIFHEYTHYVVQQNVHSYIPLWLSEGLADFYSTFQREYQGRTLVGRASGDRLAIIKSQTFMPLRDVVSPRNMEETWRWANRIGLFYSESWALVHYLLIERKNPRPYPIDTYLAALARTGSHDDAFREAFGVDVDGMDKELRDYVRRLNFRAIFLEPLADTTSNIVSEPMLEADVRQLQGRLLLELDLRDEARRELDAALKADPAHVDARISRARLALADDHEDEAIAGLQEAAAAAPKSAAAQLYLGRALARAWRHDEAIAAFTKATQLDNDNPAAWLGLSQSTLALNRDAQSNATFKVAYSLESSPGFFIGQANAAFRAGRNDLAAAAARSYLEQVGFVDDSAAYRAFFVAIADRRSGQPDSAMTILAAAAKVVQPNTWTFAVLQFLQGRLDQNQFLSMAKDVGEKTEAHAYTAFTLDIAGRHDEAMPHYQWVVEQGAKNYTEYALVKGELERLKHATPTNRNSAP